MAYPNVMAEAAKIEHIIRNRTKGRYVIIGGFVVVAEMEKIPDKKLFRAAERRYKKIIAGAVEPTAEIDARANKLIAAGLGDMDAAHLASAEAVGADYLLTTDKDFINKCSKPNFTVVKVINPLDF